MAFWWIFVPSTLGYLLFFGAPTAETASVGAKCAPGTYSLGNGCRPCPRGGYQDEEYHTRQSCKLCEVCEGPFVYLSTCTPVSNAICVCRDGLRCVKSCNGPVCGTELCKACTKRPCPDGEELLRSHCVPCLYGFYKNGNMTRCAPCQVCGNEVQYEKRECTRELNRKCGCRRPMRCIYPDCTSCTDEPCPNDEELIDDHCVRCPVGYYRSGNMTTCEKKCPHPKKCGDKDCKFCVYVLCADGQELKNGYCFPCPVGTYKNGNMSACTPFQNCLHTYELGNAKTDTSCCLQQLDCPLGHEQIGPTCIKCKHGYYKDPTMSRCKRWKKCKTGVMSVGGSFTTSGMCLEASDAVDCSGGHCMVQNPPDLTEALCKSAKEHLKGKVEKFQRQLDKLTSICFPTTPAPITTAQPLVDDDDDDEMAEI